MTRPNPDPFERAIELLLRSVVRLALKRGVAFGRFAEIVKRAYVGGAKRDFTVPNRKLSTSRISVLTGLTRKEVSRLMQDDPDEAIGDRVRRQVNRAARVVTAWVEDGAYHDRRGAPASLPFESATQPSFSDLVLAHGADVPARAVLDELVRVGAVGERSDGRLFLAERVYLPSTDEGAKFDILGTDVADLISSIEHNLNPDDRPPFFQRKVAYDNLPVEYLPRLRELLAERGQSLLEELNADMAVQDRDTNPESEDSESQARSRAMIGIYYYEESQHEGE